VLTDRRIAAAVAEAESRGVTVSEVVVLKDCFNLVLELRPARVVVRVATVTALVRPRIDLCIAREIAVAEQLASRAPGIAIRPSDAMQPGPHRRDGHWLSFWEFVEHRPGVLATPDEVGLRLRGLHTALAGCETAADYLDVPFGDIREFCRSPLGARLMEPAARWALVAEAEQLSGLCEAGRAAAQPLHGDAHPGNLLGTPDGWRWADLEETMLGPVQWDLACLVKCRRCDGAAAVAAYSGGRELELEPYLRLRDLQIRVWDSVLVGMASS
jgi:Phosphotransferase enzyme family